MIQAIQLPEDTRKVVVKMTVPLIASFLAKQQRVTDIANTLNQDHSNVSKYIKRHYDKLIPLIDTGDGLSALQSKYIAQRAKDKIDNIFDSPEAFTKKDLIPLTAVSDRHTQQYRLLSDKSTENVSVDAIQGRRTDRSKRLQELRSESLMLKGEEINV